MSADIEHRVLQDRPLPDLPEGWIPRDFVVWAVGRRDRDGRWQLLLPEFTVAGAGDTLDEALHETGELLVDYLRMSFRDGKSFEEAHRPVPPWWIAPILARAAASAIAHRVRHRAARLRLLRMPIEHAAHV